MDIRAKLLSYKNKTIEIEQIYKLTGSLGYGDLVEVINRCIKNRVLEPVKASGTNGRKPAIYNKYRILKVNGDYSEVLEDIKLLHPQFNHSKYAKNPEDYLKHRREIDALSKFLWNHEGSLEIPMAINERSFQIWGKEKLLKDSSVVKNIFKYNDWDLSMLNYFQTPEPFFEYVFESRDSMNILIVENKDTWFSLRRIMREDKLNHLYRNYHVLLYGEGKKIIRKNSRLKEYDHLLEGSNNRYYYFGDIDYEGIEIYQTLARYNKGLDINLCTELYSWMLEQSKEYHLPKTKFGQKGIEINNFIRTFNNEEILQIKEILESGQYIPQEILSYPLLRSRMKEGWKE